MKEDGDEDAFADLLSLRTAVFLVESSTEARQQSPDIETGEYVAAFDAGADHF